MAATHGTGTVVIRRSHHIACLAVVSAARDRARARRDRPELRSDRRGGRPARRHDADHHAQSDRGRLADLGRPDPRRHLELDHEHGLREAADGSRQEAAGRVAHRRRRATRPTTRPRCSTEPKGALLPLGGLDAGYKGFGLALIVEALTAGLSGFGRADPHEGWGATVFVQVLDPEAFGGIAAFRRQMDHMVDAPRTRRSRGRASSACGCRAKAGMRRLREQRANGVALYPTIMPALAPWAEKLRVAVPATQPGAAASPSGAIRPATTRGMPARSRAATISTKPRRREQRAHGSPPDRSRARRRASRRARDARARRRRSANRREAVAARRQAPAPARSADRLRSRCGSPRRDVRRIARDQVEGAPRHAAGSVRIPVRLRELDVRRCRAAARCRARRRAPSADASVASTARPRSLVRNGQRDRAGARAEIEHAHVALRRQARERELDQRLGLRPRDQHRRRHGERQPPEFADAGQVGDRLAVAAALRERAKRRRIRSRASGSSPCATSHARSFAQHVREQHLRVERNEARLRERPAHRDLTAHRCGLSAAKRRSRRS